MATGNIGPQGVTTISPPSKCTQVKIGKIEVADGSTGFAAFGLPKDAVICGIYINSTGANATQTVQAGFSASGDEVLLAVGCNGAMYAVAGVYTGSAWMTKLTADKTVYLKASATLTNPVYIKVEYYIPQQGQDF